MNTLLNAFTNRELAIIIWSIVIFLASLFVNANSIIHIRKILKILSRNDFILSLLAFVVYFLLCIYIINIFITLNFSNIKDSILWVVLLHLTVYKTLKNSNTSISYVRNLLYRNIQITLFIEFIINFYVFSLLIEIILQPVIFILYFIITICESYRSMHSKYNLIRILNTIIGCILTIFTVYSIHKYYYDFCSLQTLLSFLLPIMLLILFLPFLYIWGLYINYMRLFVAIDKIFTNRTRTELILPLKKELLLFSRLSYTKVNIAITKGFVVWHNINNLSEIKDAISKLKNYK